MRRLGRLVSVKCELICARGPRLVVSVALQHADHSGANEQQETRTVLHAWKLCADAANRHVGQIAPGRCVSRNYKVGEKANTGETALGNGAVRQPLPNRGERLPFAFREARY